MALSVDLAKVRDKQWEDKPLQDILTAPVTALAGISDTDAKHLAARIQHPHRPGLRRHQDFAAAGALVALSRHAS